MTDKPPAEAMEACPWPLRGYAPGSYTCECSRCGQQFTGDKRASECLECAVAATKEALRPTPAVPDEGLVGAVREAMADAWGEICDDTGCHPLDMRREGRKLYFEPRHWADLTALRLSERLATLSTSRNQATGLAEEADHRLCFGSMSKHEVYRAGWNEALDTILNKKDAPHD